MYTGSDLVYFSMSPTQTGLSIMDVKPSKVSYPSQDTNGISAPNTIPGNTGDAQ